MNRSPCIFACSSLEAALPSLPGRVVGIPSSAPDHMLCCEHGESLLVLLGSGVILDGIAGKWELYLALPHNCDPGNDFDSIGTKTQRAVRRASLLDSKLRGPWSLSQFEKLFPTAAKEVPGLHDHEGKLQSPRVFLGDDPHICGAADYRPTDTQALADTPTDTAKLFADAAAAVAVAAKVEDEIVKP